MNKGLSYLRPGKCSLQAKIAMYSKEIWIEMCVCVCLTLGCNGNQSSICLSNSQESKVSSVSPRKVLCPKRSWCHTETCRVRVSSWEWLTTYCTQRGGKSISCMLWQKHTHIRHTGEHRSVSPSGSRWILGRWCCSWCWFFACSGVTCLVRGRFWHNCNITHK